MSTPRLMMWLVPSTAAVAVAAAFLPPVPAAVLVAGALVLATLAARASREPPGRPVERDPPDARRGADLHPLLDEFAEGVLLLDSDGQVLAANEAAARILNRPRSAMIGVSLIRASRDYALLDLIRDRSRTPSEIVLGDQQLVQATASPIEFGDFRTILSLRDVTALRRAERARQELIANVSHELRTPITAALALAETLESGVDEADQRARFHRQLTSEIERLGSMVDRLLRLSRIEARIEEFESILVEVADLVEEACRRIAPVAERRGVRLQCEAPTEISRVRADRERILEVLENLLDNAVRHSPDGGLVILRATQDSSHVRIDVQDQGPGIMPQDRARVFERFFTADRSRGDWRGTGLGLAIARHIVSRHGGDIWVADAARGATLSFTLPVAADVNDGESAD
ncbi:MAG: ATP-binding protein [Chloroflexi bacterium]|nr:ATP-binding protein [Chloroflexota bacterium]MQC47722.1 PAS domain-containing protein [Chloroflexota bacterium]